MEETFLTSLQESISAILKISLEQAIEIARTLVESIGVVGSEDLQLLTEDDLGFLKPLQKRKLLLAWKPTGDVNFNFETTYAGYADLCNQQSSSSLPSSNWVLDFDPFDKMPDEIMQVLNEGRITAEQRRELVRVISDSIRKITVLPGKKAIGIITKGVVARFPSLKDTLCGDIIGDGNCYLSKQIKNRLENLNRGRKSDTKIRNSSITVEHPTKKPKLSDKYGCCNWQPLIVDSADDVEQKRSKMIEMSRVNPKSMNIEDLEKLIKETFPSLRADLNKNMLISEVLQKWPMIFTEIGLNVHFFELVGINLAERFKENNDKLNRVFNYLSSKEKNPEPKDKNP